MKKKNIETADQETSTGSPAINEAAASYFTDKAKEFEGRISALEKRVVPEESYFKSGKRLNNFSLFMFILIPIVQLGLLTTLFILFVNDSNFVEWAKWVIGLIGIAAIAEIIYVPVKINLIEKRIDNLEKKS